jgi:hypothetical protein
MWKRSFVPDYESDSGHKRYSGGSTSTFSTDAFFEAQIVVGKRSLADR